MYRHLLRFSIFFISFVLTAQQGVPFNSNKQVYLKGNSALIGNNIVSKHATKPYNENAFNDVLKLKYIDIDDNENTFSSSQASLHIQKKNLKIKYATLYWSAIYKYDEGFTKTIDIKNKKFRKIVYQGNNTRSNNVNTILLKTPNSEYKTIQGQTIYDSFTNEDAFEDIKPYVCYADVTSILQNSEQINGAYTVANIRATQGLISGGSAGGWLLYVIYEDDEATPKYFTTYNGFQDVFKDPIDIVFKNFKSPEVGEIKTSFIIGALEGDQKLKTDHCAFFNEANQTYIPLYNRFRPKLNFFNSTITINDSLFKNRLPNSKNTLGFDLLKIKIPNKNNSIISNNSNYAKVRFKTKADRFYLFFVAFETEINPIFLEAKENKTSILVVNQDTSLNDADLAKIKALKSISIPSVEKGYYLVTNVFSVEDNANKWMVFLKKNGHVPLSYVNPKNGWTYIYLKSDLDPSIVSQTRDDLLKLDYFKDIWILKINFPN